MMPRQVSTNGIKASCRCAAHLLHRGWTDEWIAGQLGIYDEVVEIGETMGGGAIIRGSRG